MKIEVYTDGSATTKDKPGGYGWVIVVDGEKKAEGSGWIANATNNDAELQAAIMGLGHVLKTTSVQDSTVTLVSDSEIVLGWANGRYRFKQISKKEKYDQLMFLVKRMNVQTRWIEGHAGHEHNERCDKMAREERNRAMGKISKKRVNKAKIWEDACNTMATVLNYVHQELEDLEHMHNFPRHDMIDKVEEGMAAWSLAHEKIKNG